MFFALHFFTLLGGLALGLDTVDRGEAISAPSVDLASCILGEFHKATPSRPPDHIVRRLRLSYPS